MEFGFMSLVPPLLTIILALVTKNVFVSLFIGIMTGSFVLNGGESYKVYDGETLADVEGYRPLVVTASVPGGGEDRAAAAAHFQGAHRARL